MPRKRKWTAKDDELVTFYPGVLRAYLEDSEIAVTTLADAIGRSHQVVSKLLMGDEPKRARRKLLLDVAKRLRMDLAEATTRGPELIAKIFGQKRGYETNYSARTALRARRVLNEIRHATERDLRWWPEHGLGSEPHFDENATAYILAGFSRMFTVSFLRQQLLRAITPEAFAALRRSPAKDPPLTMFGEPVDDPQHERGVLAQIASIQYAIDPWLRGVDGCSMDYSALRDLAIPPRVEHRVGFVEDWRDFGGLILKAFDGQKAPLGRARETKDPYCILNLTAGDLMRYYL
jgi:hypothetical protein